MPLVLVDTIGGPDSNAYSDAAEADESLSYRVGAEIWTNETTDQKIQDLVTGASIIDALPLRGEPSSVTQAMQFPRDGDDGIPLAVWKANILLALDAARKRQAGAVDVVNPTISNVKAAQSGDDKVEFFAPSADLADPDSLSQLPLEVQRLLMPFVVVETAGWGSATVVRAS